MKDRMMKNGTVICVGLFLVLSLWACSNDDLLYDPDQKRSIYFYKNAADYDLKVIPDTVEFSFAAREEDEYEYHIPVKCMGMPVEIDQVCEVEVVTESTTAQEGKHFEIETLIIPANKVEGILTVKLKRTEDLMEHPVVLYLRFKENEYFKPMEDDFFCLSVVDGILVEPQWWVVYYLGEYKNDNHKLYYKILEYFRELETLKPLFYAEKVKEYGRYLEKAPQDFFRSGNNMIWIKYVFKPAYDFYCDPVNKYDGFTMRNPDEWIV